MAIDATVNGANADSFITVAEADAYWATNLYPTTWETATTANKEKALKMARPSEVLAHAIPCL